MEKTEKKFFSWQGKVGRKEYILFTILILSISFVGNILEVFEANVAIQTVCAIIYILSGMKYICVIIQRLHDINRPSWHFWLYLIPIYNIYLGFLLIFKKGIDMKTNTEKLN